MAAQTANKRFAKLPGDLLRVSSCFISKFSFVGQFSAS